LNCSDIVGGDQKDEIAKLQKNIIGAMEGLMEHMQKHQRELTYALATCNYCQDVQARQICDRQGEGGARMWVFKFGDFC